MNTLEEMIRTADNFASLSPATKSQITEAEKKLQLKFSEDYKEYLLCFGVATFDNREPTGICSSDRLNVVSVTDHARQYYTTFPKDAYVIEEHLLDHIITIQDCSGNVYIYTPDCMKKIIAHSLLEYFFH